MDREENKSDDGSHSNNIRTRYTRSVKYIIGLTIIKLRLRRFQEDYQGEDWHKSSE